MRTATITARRTDVVGLAVHSFAERLHRIADPDADRLVQRAACGRQAFIVDDAEGLTPCRQCWPNARLERGLHDIWDICDDLDGRYNNTIRNLDERPLGSIF